MTHPTVSSLCEIKSGEAADTITLDETARHRRRMTLTSDNGITFLLNLPHARLLRHGEGLLLSDGRMIEVRATPEKLYRVRADSTRHLLQLAWHLGNRHCPSQIADDCLLIRHDHTLRAMLEGLGAHIDNIEAPFDPQGGAYENHHAGHDDGGDHTHDHHHHGHHHE